LFAVHAHIQPSIGGELRLAWGPAGLLGCCRKPGWRLVQQRTAAAQLDTPLHPRQPVDRQSPALAQRHTDRVQAQAHTHAHTKWEVGVLALIFLSGSCSEARSLSGLAAAVLLLDQLISAKALTGLVFPGPPPSEHRRVSRRSQADRQLVHGSAQETQENLSV